MMPRNPGKATNYGQQNQLTEAFVAAARSTIGRVCYLQQNGWGSSLPVLIGQRSSLQVTGLTVYELRDTEGNAFYSAADYQFEPDTNSEKPPRRKREKTRQRGNAFWPVLTDHRLAALQAAIDGESPDTRGSEEGMAAFLATLS